MQTSALSLPAKNWVMAGTVTALLITVFRVCFLLVDKTDLFVDESQYWLWSRDLDFGYYSKPPLIAWVIRLSTELAQSNAIFWVRLPAPLFHFATAIILGLLGKNLFGAKTAFWVMVSYISLPAVTLGSAVISTDTIMAPFFSLALLAYFRLLERGQAGDAILTGLMVGIAFLAKYAGVYFLLCAVLAAVFLPSARPSWRHALAIFLAFLAVSMPNIVWNVLNDLSTFEHTMDNAAWVRESSSGFNLKYLKLAEFFFSQFGVFGPILFATLLACVFRTTTVDIKRLVLFSVPIIVVVCIQALLSKAYANWAAAAYFAGTVAAVAVLVDRHMRLLKVSVMIGMAAAVTLPILTSIAYDFSVDGEKPALKRLLGRQKMSREILAAANSLEAKVIVARSRDIVADLFYTGRHEDVRIRTIKPAGRPKNYYQLKFPFQQSESDPAVLLVSHREVVECGGMKLSPDATISTQGGALHGSAVNVFLVSPACIDDPENH